jgi:hypothetical protein
MIEFNRRSFIREPVQGPGYGDTVTANGEVKSGAELYYHLKEWSNLGPYDARGFITLESKTEFMVVENQLEALEVLG